MKRTDWVTSRKSFLSIGLLLIASVFGAATWNRSPQPVHQATQVTSRPDATTKAQLSEAYGQLPLSFEANEGQTDPQVDFISRGSGYTLFLTPREAVLSLRTASATTPTGNDRPSAVLRMKFTGSETKARAQGHEELPGKVNYFIGKDQRQWRTGISTYAKVTYENSRIWSVDCSDMMTTLANQRKELN